MTKKTSNQPVYVGLLGTGYIAEWHAKALKGIPGVALAAVCDKDRARGQGFANRHGGVRSYESLEAMQGDQGVSLDAVHVLLPPDLHASAALSLVEKGLHVFLEKPMAVEASECGAIIEAADRRGVRVGVNHNFLFAPIYEQLRNDLKAGKLGRPDHLTVTWHRSLNQLQFGPFDLWMLRDPRNIILEIGPHCLAPVFDLLGQPEVLSVRPSNEIALPRGRAFYRRWTIEAKAGPTAVSLNLSFSPGFTEQLIHVRGSLASATVDFERNTYVLHEHTPYGLDFDRYRMIRREAKSLASQARRDLAQYVLSKLKLSKEGSPYGLSIGRALKSFYAASGPEVDSRLSARLGRDVVDLCSRIASMGVEGLPPSQRPMPAVEDSASAQRNTTATPEILLLGASGFIGRELARQLVQAGRQVRVLVRNPSKLPSDLQDANIEIMQGDLTRPADMERAIKGCPFVYHLARADVKTWEEFQRLDIDVTRQVAEACLASGVKRLIYTGTIDSYYAGAKAGTITEATPLDPQIAWRNVYARAKAASEEILLKLHRERKLPVVIFRPGIVLGQGGSPFHWGIGMWSWNAICQIWGEGKHPLPLVLVEDVARALVSALDTPGIEGESFNLVADAKLSARDYLQALEDHAGVSFQKRPTPPWKFYVVDLGKWAIKQMVRHPDKRRPSYRDWETRTQSAYYDCTKARTVLNWNPVCDREEFIRLGIQAPGSGFIGPPNP